MICSNVETSFYRYDPLRQQGSSFVVGGFVGVIGRAVACGETAGFLRVLERSGFVAAGEGEFGEFKVGVRALQDVAAALGEDQRLLGQPRSLFRRAGGGAQPRQVNEDVGFDLHQVDAAAAFQRLVQAARSLVVLSGDAVRGAQQPVGADEILRKDRPPNVGIASLR